jgi:hypothetical protein
VFRTDFHAKPASLALSRLDDHSIHGYLRLHDPDEPSRADCPWFSGPSAAPQQILYPAKQFLVAVAEVVDLTDNPVQVVGQIRYREPVARTAELRTHVDMVPAAGKLKVEAAGRIAFFERTFFVNGKRGSALRAVCVDVLDVFVLTRKEAEQLGMAAPEGVEEDETARIVRDHLEPDRRFSVYPDTLHHQRVSRGALQLFDHKEFLTVPMDELHTFGQRIQKLSRDLAMNKIHLFLFRHIVNPLKSDVKLFALTRAVKPG